MTMDPQRLLSVVWQWLLDALEGDDAERVYVLAALFGLLTDVFVNPSHTLDFTGVDDLVRMSIRPLMTTAAVDFTEGEDAAGEEVVAAAFRILEVTGVEVGG